MKTFTPAKISTLLLIGSTLATSLASADTLTGGLYSSKNLKVVEQALPEYPLLKDRAGKEGFVIVEFTVAPDGSVLEPAVKDTTAPAFSRAALTAINQWQFEPVVDAGTPVPVRTNMKFSFVPRTE
ncbi:MAG: energy transducer TonB [Pseudomonadales bacterium]|nr:energy transducer TonB [Pseudomonadales bacterium]